MNEVVIKKYQSGLSVILNPDIPFETLYTALGRKFRESAKFFGEARLVISFEGRELYPEEERLVVDAISDNSDLTILHVMGDDDGRNRQYLKAGNRFISNDAGNLSADYTGTVRAGETLETDTDIIVLGDVNPGGEVISAGNIIIFGTLYGTAKAGKNGDNGNFIIALELKPVRACIGDLTVTQFARKSLFRAKTAPKILFSKDGSIVIEEITPENADKLAVGMIRELKVKRRMDEGTEGSQNEHSKRAPKSDSAKPQSFAGTGSEERPEDNTETEKPEKHAKSGSSEEDKELLNEKDKSAV